MPIVEVGSDDVGMGNSLLSEALLSLDEINSSKCIPIGDGKVKCLICERELKRDSWKRHISSVHSNNRPYSCNMCNTTFKVSQKSSPIIAPVINYPVVHIPNGSFIHVLKLAHDMYKHKRLKHGEEHTPSRKRRIDDSEPKLDAPNFDIGVRT